MSKDLWIWIDGQFVPKNAAKISAFSQTFHYGFGVYEGIRSYENENGPAIFRLTDHVDRLFQSAALLNIRIPYEVQTVCELHVDVMQKNQLTNAYLRPVVFMGDEYLGLHTQQSSVHLMIAAIPWNNFYIKSEQINRGISLKTSTHERMILKNDVHKAKANGHYLISILANNEAHDAGCDEALMLDSQGYIAEGSGANIFMVKNNQLHTPLLHCVLDGITRKTVIQIAADQGIETIEKNITPDELLRADEVFFTGTAAEVLAITKIDGHVIGTGVMGKTTQQLRQLYIQTVTGKIDQYQHWLSRSSEAH